jgi:spermidine/putrescine transport system permease protein
MLGNVIADQILYTRNWPFASAISMALTVITTAGVLIMMGMQRRETARITDTTKIEEGRTANGNGGAL